MGMQVFSTSLERLAYVLVLPHESNVSVGGIARFLKTKVCSVVATSDLLLDNPLEIKSIVICNPDYSEELFTSHDYPILIQMCNLITIYRDSVETRRESALIIS